MAEPDDGGEYQAGRRRDAVGFLVLASLVSNQIVAQRG
jgi:hypothetical protein